MSNSRSFSKSVKIAAWNRCQGICECGCGQKIITPEYDHFPVPHALGGDNSLENVRVLAKRCHRVMTEQIDVPQIAKSQRIFEKRIGARTKRGGFRGHRKFDGSIVWK